ncbi:hypothetical protein M0R19_00145 [Candidatus Pacearchaeota archaeon]|nr:hypothetical protein [Candidatus Pacearchaeota archaeon]
MGVLDQIMQMKRQGVPDEEIVNSLSQSGISPKEISDALKQAQIKDAVSYGDEEMQPSIIQGGEAPAPAQAQEYYAPQEYQPQQEAAYQPQQQEAQQYYAPEAGYAQAGGGVDTDTVIEIADQVFSDKIKKIQKQTDAVSEAAIVLQTKTESISERLKKIESIIDKLQISILEKVGSYGQNLESIKKEMGMMQDSFSKMVSPSKERQISRPASSEDEARRKK